MLRESETQSKSPTHLPFTNISKHHSINITTKVLVIVVEVILTTIANSRSNSRSKYSHNHSSHNHPPYYNRNRSRYDQYYRKSPSPKYFVSHSYYNSTSSRSSKSFILIIANAPRVIITTLSDAKITISLSFKPRFDHY